MKLFKSLTIICLATTVLPVMARFSVSEIHPPHWWIGFHDTTLQLQVHGHDVRQADLSIDYPGVRIDSVVRLNGSPDWQYVYLNIAPDTHPGTMTLRWKQGKQSVEHKYELRPRTRTEGARGFTSADVLYMIMPDRFADAEPDNNTVPTMRHRAVVDRTNPNVRHGGDLAGIKAHIPYIDSLGVTAVWLTPVLENDMPGGSYHGYATTDYYKIDPRLGTNKEYSELVKSLHSQDIKTVMDMVFNHCGSGHPWLEAPPSDDWFNFPDTFVQTNYRLSTITDPYASDYDRAVTTDGWFVREMPDLNQRNPHVMKYLTQNSLWWIEEVGIDGIRMDTYPYADYTQMGKWVNDIRKEYPDFNIVGECWFGQTAGEAFWQKNSPLAHGQLHDTSLPVVMDFPFMILNRDMAPFREETDPWNGLNKIYDHLSLDYVYPDPLSVMRFLDNHDTERFILSRPDSLDQWKQALTLLLTLPGIPQIYYGTELLMAGDRKGGDGNVRRDMPGGFPGDTVDMFSHSSRPQPESEAYDFIARLCQWRKTNSAAHSGKMKHFMPDNGLYLFRRDSGNDTFIAILNGKDEPLQVDMSRYSEVSQPGQIWRDILTGREVTIIPSDRKHTFAPREILILEPLK